MASQKKQIQHLELLKNKMLPRKMKRQMSKKLRLTERNKRMMLKLMKRMRVRKLKN